MGFNRMARELAKVGRPRRDAGRHLARPAHAAGRLRLETGDERGRRTSPPVHGQDIDQLDAIIDKFMDYARPSEALLRAVPLAEVVEREAQGFRDAEQIGFKLRVSPALSVYVDETELGRVLLNLFENARRYGHQPGLPARVEVSASRHGDWVHLEVRDHGPGVPPDRLARLTTPFYRGTPRAPPPAAPAWGLAIVEKSIQRMGGQLSIHNAEGGGLLTVVRLRAA